MLCRSLARHMREPFGVVSEMPQLLDRCSSLNGERFQSTLKSGVAGMLSAASNSTEGLPPTLLSGWRTAPKPSADGNAHRRSAVETLAAKRGGVRPAGKPDRVE